MVSISLLLLISIEARTSPDLLHLFPNGNKVSDKNGITLVCEAWMEVDIRFQMANTFVHKAIDFPVSTADRPLCIHLQRIKYRPGFKAGE